MTSTTARGTRDALLRTLLRMFAFITPHRATVAVNHTLCCAYEAELGCKNELTWLDFCSALDRKPNRQPRCHSGRQSLTSRRTPSTSPLGVRDVTRAPWGQWKVSERPRGITLGDAPRARHRRRPVASRRRPPRPSATTPHRPPYHVDVSRRRRPAEARGTYRSRASAYPHPLPRALTNPGP